MIRLDGVKMADRNDKGQFIPGSGGGPGRPKRRTEEQYLDAMISRVTVKDWREIVDKAVSQAKRGDSRARVWLSDYLLGPAPQRLQHEGSDGGPVKLVVEYVNKRTDNNATDTA